MGWQGFTSRAEKKVALLYVNTAQTDYEKTDGLASIHSRPWGRSLCTPRTQYQPIAGMVWCTASHVLNAPAPTLAKQVGPWTIAFMNSARLWKRRPRILCSCWACVLLEPSSGSIEGHGDWHPKPHPDPLHAGVLAHPAPPVPPQQGEGHLVRTLCCTTDLTMHPSGVIPFSCCYYY